MENMEATTKNIDALLNSLEGERVTKDYINSRIARVEYHIIPKSTVTVCNLTLDNGFSVRGESACVDPANFNAEIGEHFAHENAYTKLWQLFGFMLAEKRHMRKNVAIYEAMLDDNGYPLVSMQNIADTDSIRSILGIHWVAVEDILARI